MKSNPLLDEIWRIKDELAREAEYDIHRLCEQTREWAKTHAHDGPIIREAGELRRLLAQEETACVREEPGAAGSA
jgi:hypothetical protein